MTSGRPALTGNSAHMTARIIDGKILAAELRAKIAAEVRALAARGVVPGLAAVLVGDNPASEIYVRNKTKAVQEAGMRSFDHRLPGTAGEAELLALVQRLNDDPQVHGILVQLPLPAGIDASKIIAAVDPAKDVDGFHPLNVGKLNIGSAGAGALHAARMHSARQSRSPFTGGHGSRGDRPLQHRRQAARAIAVARECDGDHRAFQDAAICLPCAAAQTCWSPRSGAPR